jgi:drug/metabolite transporter (DMT)-like permease
MEKIGRVKIISLIMSITGVYTLAGSKGTLINMTGVLLAIISGCFYSLYTIELGRDEIKSMVSLLLTFYVSLLSGTSTLIYGAATRSLKYCFQLSGLIAVLALALVCTVFAVLAYARAVQVIGPSDTALFSTFEPVTGVIMGILIFGERLSLASATGSAMIIISVLLLSYNSKIQSSNSQIEQDF